jgi:hypothetical protein
LDELTKRFTSLPEGCEIECVVYAEGDQIVEPEFFRVRVERDARLYRVSRAELLSREDGRTKIIEYYERLIVWRS